MGNLGTYRLPFRGLSPHVPYVSRDPKTGKPRNNSICFSELMDRIMPYFTIPRSEQVRLVNCLFHEILTCIREGKEVKVPYFGRFHGQYFAGRVLLTSALINLTQRQKSYKDVSLFCFHLRMLCTFARLKMHLMTRLGI